MRNGKCVWIFFLFCANNHGMGEMQRAIAREVKERTEYEARIKDGFAYALVIAASTIAPVRLPREEHIGRPSPKVFRAVADAVSLARMILDEIIRRTRS